MKPTASSATASTKPALARVTSTPLAEAAPTSTLRMSTAQRTKATRSGSCSNTAAGPSVMRSETMIWQPPASSISCGVDSAPPVSLRRTSPSSRNRASASSP